MIASERKKLNYLIVLIVVAGLMYFWNRNSGAGIPGVASVANTGFQPLNVDDPGLRLDLLKKIHELEYSGAHRNIFSAVALPPEPSAAQKAAEARRSQGPVLPPPPPPPSVPATFFGYVSNPGGANRLGFFQSGEDVYVVGEGSLLLSNFRLLKIGNDTAEFEEVSTGRKASLAMTQPVGAGGTGGAADPGAKPPGGQGGDSDPAPQ
jgi:hypothetical protein